MHQAMKIPDATAAVDKEWDNLGKLPALRMTKLKSKTEVIQEAQREQSTVHSASLMAICYLKNVGLEPQFQKHEGRVVLRGHIVKDDPGSYAVFTEQSSSASQITAAKEMDVIARQPGCAGQAADAVSACTQVKVKDAPKLLRNPEAEGPDICTRLPLHKWPKSWSNIADIVVILKRHLYVHPLAG